MTVGGLQGLHNKLAYSHVCTVHNIAHLETNESTF